MQRNLEKIMADLEANGVDLNNLAASILERIEREPEKRIVMATRPNGKPRKNSPGAKFRREVQRKGLVVVPML